MNPEVYLDRLIEKREAGEEQFSIRNDEIASSLAAAETLMQLQKIDVPPAFAHRLESSIRTRVRSQRLTQQNGQSISTGPLHSPVNLHSLPKHRSWVGNLAAIGIAAILVLAFTALVATFTGSLVGSPPAGSKPVVHQITNTFAVTPQNPINDQIMQLHNAIIDLGTMVNDRRDDNAIQQALTSVATSTIDCQKAVAALPAGSERDTDQQNLNSVLAEENQTLRSLLNHVDWPLRLDFTQQLGVLGNTVPNVTHGMIHTQSNGTLLITLTGTDFAPHAVLIVDGGAMGIVTQSTSWQLVAVISRSNWSSGTHAFGILNPDGTATQMVLKVGNSGHDE
jgi:hypothetical protein